MNQTSIQDKGRTLNPMDPSIADRYALNDIYSTAWLSHALTALARNRVPDLIGDEPIAFANIAEKANLHAPSLYRVLRAAAANGIFIEHSNGRFAHNGISSLLKSNHPFSWKGMACMWNHPSCLAGWTKFSECLHDGRSGIEHAFGKPLYQHLEEIPGGTLAFSDAMISNSAHASISIAKEFDFNNFHLVMDLAGGVGTLLCAILQAQPHLKGIIYEIAELKSEGEIEIAKNNLVDRAYVLVGDFLKDIPKGPDLFMVKNSLWNWNDEQCGAIMSNVHAASIGDAAKFLIIEYIIDEQNSAWTTLYDLQILNMPGGRARTLAEYEELLNKSGFAIERVQRIEDQTLLLAQPK